MYTLGFNCWMSDLGEFLGMLIIGNEKVEFQASELGISCYLLFVQLFSSHVCQQNVYFDDCGSISLKVTTLKTT